MKRTKTQLALRLRRVFLPWLISAAGLWGAYSFLHWLVLVWFEPSVLPGDLILFIVPLTLSVTAVVLWVRHGVQLLKWPGNDASFLGSVIAALLLWVPAIVAQQHLENTIGTLTHLERVGELADKPKTRFYSIGTFAVDKAYANRELRTWTSGRDSRDWNVAVYYVAQLLDPSAPPGLPPSRVFIGVRYHRRYRNDATDDERRVRVEQLLEEADREFARDRFERIGYFERARAQGDRRAYDLAVSVYQHDSLSENAVVLVPRFGSFATRSHRSYYLMWLLFTGAVAIWLLIALTLRLDHARIREARRRKDSPNSDLGNALAFLVPRAGYAVTPLLLHLNLLVWAAMSYRGLGLESASATDLLGWGGLHADAIERGEGWRLLTALFVHANLAHIAYNLIVLGLVGWLVERAFGSWWFGSVYFATGIAAGLASLSWNPGIVLVGASGSIFGAIGFGLALLLLKRRRFREVRSVLMQAAIAYLGINLVMGLVLPNIALVAHIAGLAGGMILGLCASLSITDKPASGRGLPAGGI